MRLYIGLLHFPVYNKNYQRITSAITVFDLHDLSRLARSYGVKRFFVITPLKDQQLLANRVVRHWTTGYGAGYNPDRKKAVELIMVVPSLDASIEKITEMESDVPLIVATDAYKQDLRPITYKNTIKIINSERVILLIFGTAWGLEKEVIEQADYILDPIKGVNDYNHLSVRTASAIILDRLLGVYN